MEIEPEQYDLAMWWIPLVTAAVGAGVAIGLAVQNRRWARRDADASTELEHLRRRVVALEEVTRETAREVYDAIPWRMSRNLTDDINGLGKVEATQRRFEAVATLRARVFLLPEPWRGRLDWLLVGMAHGFCDVGAAEDQLRTDLRSLLYGDAEPAPAATTLRDLMLLLELRDLGVQSMTSEGTARAQPAA